MLKPYKTNQPLIGKNVYIDDSAVVIGNVTLGDDVSIWPTAVVRGDVESIFIGNGSNIQDGSVLHVTHASTLSVKSYPLSIGKNVTIGHKVVVHACTIGNYCLIGIGSIILDGAVLEDYVMLGAGTLVTPKKHLESGYLYIGTPAKKARPLQDSELQYLKYSAKHYIDLKDNYLKG